MQLAYEAAFDHLREETRRLQELDGRAAEPDNAAARRRVADAFSVYREARNRLAEYLMTSGSQRAKFLTGFQDELQFIAYQLWEKAGRPSGNPDEHWYQAERILRSRP